MADSRLYRCRAKVLYKFYNSDLAVVIDENQIQDLNINLGWEPNTTTLNNETTDTSIMSFTGSMNTCSVSISDPYLTGLAWPSLTDVAGAAIGAISYQSSTILLPQCKEGQDPQADKCWNYELLDLTRMQPTNNANSQLSSLASTYSQQALLMISLWYEAYNGYTFGTDYLFKVNGASVSHGKEYPTVTITGQGNFGVTFQDRLVNVSVDNTVEVEKALKELAEQNNFNLEFCVADYDTPNRLERKVIKSNLTIKQLLDDIIKTQKGGEYLSLPTRDMYNTLHVCTRADTWPGCSVFYLGKPLYEGYKVSALIDPTVLGRNQEFANSSPAARASRGSNYLPSTDSKDSAWEILTREGEKNTFDIEKYTATPTSIKVEYKNKNVKAIEGSWAEFKAPRSKYFSTYAEKLPFLELQSGSGQAAILRKVVHQKVNPGVVGQWNTNTASAVYSGRVTNVSNMAEGGGKKVTVKTDYVLYLRGISTRQVSKLTIFVTIANITPLDDVKADYRTELGAPIGSTSKDALQNMTFYVVNNNTQQYLDPKVVLEYAVPETYEPEIGAVPESLVPESKSTLCFENFNITPANRNTSAVKNKIGANNIILTFDDGPDSTWTPKILDVLKKHGATATFFLIGNRISGRESIVRRIISEGHDIASHSYSHPNFAKELGQNKAARLDQLTNSLSAIASATSRKPSSFRFPYGAGSDNPTFVQEVNSKDMGVIYWHLDPQDWRAGSSAEKMISLIESQGVSGGKIVLFHDGLDVRAGSDPKVTTTKAETVKAVDAFLTKYKGKFKFDRNLGDILATSCEEGVGGDDNNYSEEMQKTTESAPTSASDENNQLLVFKWPTNGVFSSGYGQRQNRMHSGIDIAAPLGTPVYAAAPGRVLDTYNGCPSTGECVGKSPPYEGYGNIVLIDHGSNYLTFYAHLQKDSIKVKPGDIVGYDTQIGAQGDSGYSRGNHLHFEIRTGSSIPGTAIKPTVCTPPSNIKKGTDNCLKQPGDGTTIKFDGVSVSPGGQGSATPGQTAPGRGTGFSIETEFKGVPRALRILPKFTILSIVTKYQEWLDNNRLANIDPGVWVPDYFKNWLIRTVQFMWSQGDLRIKISASSVFGIDTKNLVPTWKSYAADLKANGFLSDYVDYIRAYGDLCWNDGGKPSCHTRCSVTEDFMLAAQSGSTSVSSADVSSLSGCQLEPGKLNLSAEDEKLLFQITAAEAGGEGPLGMALVLRSILIRKLAIEKHKINYGTTSSNLRDIIYAGNGSQFEPVRSTRRPIDGNYEVHKADYEKAKTMAFDYDALRKQGISNELLASPNFRSSSKNVPLADNWINAQGYIYKGHRFGIDTEISKKWTVQQTLEAFSERYGKCTRTGTTTSATPTSTDFPYQIPRSSIECYLGQLMNDTTRSGTYFQPSASSLKDIGNGYKLASNAADAFNKLKEAASADGISIFPVSGYRSGVGSGGVKQGEFYYYQDTSKVIKNPTSGASAGKSQHNTGYGVDIINAESKNAEAQLNSAWYKWMTTNAYKYGFINSFPPKVVNGKLSHKVASRDTIDPTTYIVTEPWHWLFVGSDAARSALKLKKC